MHTGIMSKLLSTLQFQQRHKKQKEEGMQEKKLTSSEVFPCVTSMVTHMSEVYFYSNQ